MHQTQMPVTKRWWELKYKFVWNNGKAFTTEIRRTIINYAIGAFASFGKGCGKVVREKGGVHE